MNGKIILNLFLRDFKVYHMRILSSSFILLMVGMFIIFINSSIDNAFEGSTNLIVVLIIISFLPELKNKNVWTHTASLPVLRKEMVVSRYLISVCIVTTNLIIWLLVFTILKEVLYSESQYSISGKIVFYAWGELLLNLALFYFVFYRFNYIIVIGFYVFMMIASRILQVEFNLFLENYSLNILYISLFIFSLYISIIHFKKKDL